MMTIENIVQKLNNTQVLVIGDFVLDKYIEVNKFENEVDGDPFGLEYAWQKQIDTIGAAGIVARQCKELCPHVSCIGAIGTDIIGRELTDSFKKQSIWLGNIVDHLKIRENIASPFRERIFRKQNIQVLKLIRNDYKGQALLEHLNYDGSLSKALLELPKTPNIVFLCDYSQGFFTDGIVFKLGQNLILKDKLMILKTRKWKDVYKYLPINVLFLDFDTSWTAEKALPSAVERYVSNIAKQYRHPICMICNFGKYGFGLFEFNPLLKSKENDLSRREYIDKGVNKVGLFSVITALVGVLVYGDNFRKESFFDDTLSLITFIKQMPISWEYEIASLEKIKECYTSLREGHEVASPTETTRPITKDQAAKKRGPFETLTESKKTETSTTFHATASNGGIIVFGPVQDSQVTNNLITNDFSSIEKVLSSNNVSFEDITELKSALKDDDPPQKSSDNFGPKVSAWISKMKQKASEGSWSITVGAAGKLLADAISRYYGLNS